MILLIGPSGSGKSSFVKSLTGEIVQLNGHKPCTPECKAYKVEPIIDGRLKSFILIDTPGFVDQPEKDLKILENIAMTLTKMAPDKVFGAIYFHNITEVRMTGTGLSVLDIFKAICGERFYPHVAFVTTMWDTIKPQFHRKFQITNTELGNGPMKLKGAPGVFRRLRDDDECSKDVLQHFALLSRQRATPPPLLLMMELRGEIRGEIREVGNTAAGRRILKDERSGPRICCAVM
ncbi:P-loop containing nucleoside triphosphate hydrolase protein [Cercophora newfieldiana]|uniref:P-loop containing nucleoside triphosphate hydrolase protein n=1 Tax=Cercophora newfieldiana TaxID=92897 RepID=A0AA40CXA6_9PEZI|nr:P-loop containing nucleoside triphosphate hydrolase protein [Cercophora newfieldiana]